MAFEKFIKLDSLKHPLASMMSTVKNSVPSPDEEIKLTLHLRCNRNEINLPHDNDLFDLAKRKMTIIDQTKFAKKYGGETQDIEQIKKFAQAFGIHVGDSNITERWVDLIAPIKVVEKVFKISMVCTQHGKDTIRFNKSSPQIPSELKDIIISISGLSDESAKTERPFMSNPDPDSGTAQTMRKAGSEEDLEGSRKPRAVDPRMFLNYYDFPVKYDGKGQTIGIISLGGGYDPAHLKKYFDSVSIPMPSISWVGVDGAINDPGKNQRYDYEVAMDVQIAGSMAPGAKIVVYFAPNKIASIAKSIKAAVHDHKNSPSVVSVSWGTTESKFTESERITLHDTLKEAAMMNITVCCSTGDLGSSGINGDKKSLNVQLPAISPFALAIGGSMLEAEKKESVWSEKINWQGVEYTAATGGGYSTLYNIPQYQTAAIEAAKSKVQKRGMPDVAGNASNSPGIKILINGEKQISIGTSATTPMWAGLIARFNQCLKENKLKPIGFANPFFYKLANTAAFKQITKGSNGAYKAGKYWNPCTGLGTPVAQKLMDEIIRLMKEK